MIKRLVFLQLVLLTGLGSAYFVPNRRKNAADRSQYGAARFDRAMVRNCTKAE